MIRSSSVTNAARMVRSMPLHTLCASTEHTQPEVSDRQSPARRAHRLPGAVVGQSRLWLGDLLGQPDDQRFGQFNAADPALAGVAKKGDVECQPQPVLRAPVCTGQIKILAGQYIVAVHGFAVVLDEDTGSTVDGQGLSVRAYRR